MAQTKTTADDILQMTSPYLRDHRGLRNCHPYSILQYCPWDPKNYGLQGANPFGLNPAIHLSTCLPLNNTINPWASAGLPMSECSAGWQPEHSAPYSGFKGEEYEESSCAWWWLTTYAWDTTVLFRNCWPDLLPFRQWEDPFGFHVITQGSTWLAK